MLPGHAPLLSELKAGGVLSYKSDGRAKRCWRCYGGFVEVLPDRVRILADAAERKEEINVEAARQELSKAVELDDIERAQAKIDAASK